MIENHRVISIVGNAKNAGKTTVINYLIDNYFNHVIALTSIGLDGEEIDQITFQEKPRIFAKVDFIIATAKTTLKFFEAEYKILEETNINTSIGKIVIVKIISEGNVLIAGPSIISEMQEIISLLYKYNPDKIFIDGAFFRHSTAKISQATILVIGANLSADIDRVINNARLAVTKFSLDEYANKKRFDGKENICFIDEDDNLIELNFASLLGRSNEIFVEKYRYCKYIYLPKALTNDFVKEYIANRGIYNFDIIVNSPVSIQLDEINLENIFKINRNVFVRDSVNLVALCYNPASPRGYQFEEKEFRTKLSRITSLDVINVKEDV